MMTQRTPLEINHKEQQPPVYGQWLARAKRASEPREYLNRQHQRNKRSLEVETWKRRPWRRTSHSKSPSVQQSSSSAYVPSDSSSEHLVQDNKDSYSEPVALASTGWSSKKDGLAEPPLAQEVLSAGRSMARSMMKRRPRGGRMYDVPQIECPRSNDRMERFACPSPDFRGRYRCIDDRSLCDGFFDCPGQEDENPDQCLFYKTTKAHLDILAEALLRWARGR